MANFLEMEFMGKHGIDSHFNRCESCRRLTVLSTYSTTRFAKLFNIPVFPAGKFRMVNECPQCGFRGIVSARKYAHDRKKNLALMMEGFASEADNPENCAHALQTLIVYGENSWFSDVQKSYGLRFETNPQIQLLIAQGLCRFGDYPQAIAYCRKAIVLKAGRPAEELLSFCQTLQEASEDKSKLDALKVTPESSMRAYIPLTLLVTTIATFLTIQGISSLRNYKAWIVNGSLRNYTFSLDDQTYALRPGERTQIKLRLGKHELKFGSMPANQFTYSIPLIRQMLDKQLLVINPDSMALLAASQTPDKATVPETTYSLGKQIRVFPGLAPPLRGIPKLADASPPRESICLYRPDTHMQMVALMQDLGLENAAIDYARLALTQNPATGESAELLPVAAKGSAKQSAETFLRKGLDIVPPLLPWHRFYQDYMQIHHPEHNLEHEYAKLCKHHPDEPGCYYLLARIMQDRPAAYKFLEHAEKGKGMGGLGYHAIARELFVRGRFRDALPYSEKALKRAPANDAVRQLNEQIRLALRDYDALVEHIQSESTKDPERARQIVLYLTCAGYHREAEAEAARLGKANPADLPSLNATRFYAVGNVNTYLEYLVEANDPHAEIEKLLHQGRIADADAAVSRQGNLPYREHLVLYCAAANQGFINIAKRNLDKAISEIGRQSPDRNKMASMLSEEGNPSLEDVRNLDIPAKEKALLCVALGYRFPEMQVAMNDLSRTYNFTPEYPQLLIKKWIRQANQNPGKPTALDNQTP